MAIQINNKLWGSDKFYGKNKPYTFSFCRHWQRNSHLEEILQISHKVQDKNLVYFFVNRSSYKDPCKKKNSFLEFNARKILASSDEFYWE